MGAQRKFSRDSTRTHPRSSPGREGSINIYCLDSPERVAACHLRVVTTTKLASPRHPSRVGTQSTVDWSPTLPACHLPANPCSEPRPQLSLSMASLAASLAVARGCLLLPVPVMQGLINDLLKEGDAVALIPLPTSPF